MIKKIFLLAIISVLILLIVISAFFISSYGDMDEDKELLIGKWIQSKNNLSTLITFTIDGVHKVQFSVPEMETEIYNYEVLADNSIRAYNDNETLFYDYEFINDDLLRLGFRDVSENLFFKRIE